MWRAVLPVPACLALVGLTVACAPSSGAPTAAVTVTATVTETVTANPEPTREPSESAPLELVAADAQHIVDALCRISAAYADFEQVASDLQARSDLFKEARTLAGEVAFSVDAATPRLLTGPPSRWSDPWWAVAALTVADSVDSSRPLFESAARVSSVDELVGMTMSVLGNPLDDPLVYDLAQRLPPDQGQQLLACAST